MLIEVGDDIIDQAKNDDPVAIEILEQLADAYRRNKHLIYLSYEQLCSVSQIGNLDLFYKSIYGRLHNKIASFIGPLKRAITFNAIVSYNDPINPNKLWINPAIHNTMELYTETHLLVENLLDVDFYCYVVEYYQSNNAIESCSICYYALHGGGNTIKDVYKREIELKQHFCFAIVDSDKKYPDGEYGQTSKELQSIHDTEKPFNCRYYRMENVSEIENLIPISIVELYGNNSHNSIFKPEHNLPSNFFSYFDMKKDFVGCNMKSENMYKYYLRLLDFDNILKIKLEECESCLSNKNYSVDKNTKAICSNYKIIIAGFGSNLLFNVLNDENCKAGLDAVRECDLTNDQREEWNKIGRIIFEWCCCAEKPRRA